MEVTIIHFELAQGSMLNCWLEARPISIVVTMRHFMCSGTSWGTFLYKLTGQEWIAIGQLWSLHYSAEHFWRGFPILEGSWFNTPWNNRMEVESLVNYDIIVLGPQGPVYILRPKYGYYQNLRTIMKTKYGSYKNPMTIIKTQGPLWVMFQNIIWLLRKPKDHYENPRTGLATFRNEIWLLLKPKDQLLKPKDPRTQH